MFEINYSAGLAFLAVSIVTVIYMVYVRLFHYWRHRNMPCIRLISEFSKFGKEYVGFLTKDIYDTIKTKGLKHAGLYVLIYPTYMPISPNILKRILQQDFAKFAEKGFYYNEKDDVISANLFALGGEKWKRIRTKITPSLTINKIKLVFGTLLQCSYQMQAAVDEIYQNRSVVEIKDIAERYTIDIIGSCLYGLDCNSFKDPNSEFRIQSKKIFNASLIRILNISWACLVPNVARFFGITMFTRETRQFFVNIVKEIVEYRRENDIIRKDILQSLLELIDPQQNNNALTVEEVSAQAFICFAAGFETSAITVTFCMYELSLDGDVQDKARDEIMEILNKHDMNLSYESVMEMQYLDQVVDETLRKYPPVSFLTRMCTADYNIPDTDIVLEKGTSILVSILGLHRDEEYFPNPEKFDPERFSPTNKPNIKPFTYMPFGEGPRICIGLRFGLLQVKVALVSLLLHYKFSLNEKTEVPLVMDPTNFTLTPKNGIYLNVEKVRPVQVELRNDSPAL